MQRILAIIHLVGNAGLLSMARIIFKLLIYSSFFLTKCYGQEKKEKYHPLAIEWNNKATVFIRFQNYDSALFYLDKAIEVDSSLYTAYENKSSVYCTLIDYKKAVIETKRILLIKPDLAEAWIMAGMLSDKIGDTLNALSFYRTSIEIFERRLKDPNRSKQSEANSINRVLSLILIGKESEARKEINRLKGLYPNNKMLGQMLTLDKKDYLKEIFGI